MKQLFYCSLWKSEDLEKKLSDMEQKGYRLDKVSGLGTYTFIECKPRNTQYFFTFFYGRGEISMYQTEQWLKENGANEIKGKLRSIVLSGKSVFRITSDVNLTEARKNRNIQIIGILIRSIILEAFLLVMFSVVPILQLASVLPLGDGYDIFGFVILMLASLLMLFFLLHNTIGYMCIKKKIKNS